MSFHCRHFIIILWIRIKGIIVFQSSIVRYKTSLNLSNNSKVIKGELQGRKYKYSINKSAMTETTRFNVAYPENNEGGNLDYWVIKAKYFI